LLKTQLNRVVFASYRRGQQLIVMTENAIAKEIVDAAYRIHTTLGPGLLESVYDTVLAYELNRRGLRTTRQQAIPVVYENVRIDAGFRADMIVEDKVIVEVKSVELLAPVHKKQLLTYLRLADKRLGCSSTSKWRSSKTASRGLSMDSKKKTLTQSRKVAKTR
jgi:GxxExxY protein